MKQISNQPDTLQPVAYESWENDARIAARRAMAKRSSRSFSARISRAGTKSRRKEKFGRAIKPGIKLDTSFARHRGNEPRQVYPQYVTLDDSNGAVMSFSDFAKNKNVEATKKRGWWRSPVSTKLSGNDSQSNTVAMRTIQPPSAMTTRTEEDPETASSLKPGRNSWMEVSPSDRPIPIGISVPTESISDQDSFRFARGRSGSDATLVTPSIIITPAVMKSVWSPDTASDYTPRPASSVYSRATFFAADALGIQNAPPVPALPSHLNSQTPATAAKDGEAKTSAALSDSTNSAASSPTHVRNDTLDSAVTAFEEDEDIRRKERIMSTATVFEEDETPILRQRNPPIASTLSLDTNIIPTPRRSQGWWNVITTPFMLSRTNSVWTRRTADNGEMTPMVPAIPQKFGMFQASPSIASSYNWSATERSASVRGTNDLLDNHPPPPQPFSPLAPARVAVKSTPSQESPTSGLSPYDRDLPFVLSPELQPPSNQPSANGPKAMSVQEKAQAKTTQQSPESRASSDKLAYDHAIASPASPSPVVATAAIGTFLMPREVNDRSRQMPEIVELRDRQPVALNIHGIDGHPQPQQVLVSYPTPSTTTASPPQQNGQYQTPLQRTIQYQTPPQFPLPPTQVYSSPRGSPKSNVETKDASERRKSRSCVKQGLGKLRKFKTMEIFGNKSQKGPKDPKKPKKKRSRRCCCLWSCCCLLFLCLIAIIVPVVVVLTRKHNDSEPKPSDVPSQWLNLTGFPPIPTGISTVAQPDAAVENSGCVSPATVWSCALPKEQQNAIAPNKPDQPNFRLQITFENGTISDPSKTQPALRRDLAKISNPVSAGAFIRSKLLSLRSTPSPSPAVPSDDDQNFLGNTTDGNVQPFDGEQTPFFISFLDPNKTTTTSSRLARRDDDPFSNITDIIPPPTLNSDGTAAAANLLPLPVAQPLKLYNRGKDTEHYGFYTYFDRAISLKSITPTNSTFGGVPADTNGGSPFDGATMRCTWSQTRFLVQIWTRSQSTKPLLQGTGSAPATPTSTKSAAVATSTASSGNDFNRPGNFPYPVTITLDRHGGENDKKMIYCYGMDTSGKIISDQKSFVLEDRAFGGVAVNPSEGPSVGVSGLGIDGGTGGCQCSWQNWLD